MGRPCGRRKHRRSGTPSRNGRFHQLPLHGHIHHSCLRCIAGSYWRFISTMDILSSYNHRVSCIRCLPFGMMPHLLGLIAVAIWSYGAHATLQPPHGLPHHHLCHFAGVSLVNYSRPPTGSSDPARRKVLEPSAANSPGHLPGRGGSSGPVAPAPGSHHFFGSQAPRAHRAFERQQVISTSKCLVAYRLQD